MERKYTQRILKLKKDNIRNSIKRALKQVRFARRGIITFMSFDDFLKQLNSDKDNE